MPTDYEGGTLTGDVYAYVSGKYVRVVGLQGETLTQADEQLGKLDYVRVVRCKDCRFWEEQTLGAGICCGWRGTMEDDYCSFGERRTDG